MMSIAKLFGSGATRVYYQLDNYYAESSQEGAVQWRSKDVEASELFGKPLDPKFFEENLSSDRPIGPKAFRLVNGEKKLTAGYDMTFAAPKSLSILTEVFRQTELSDAHDSAVRATLKWVKKNALKDREWNSETKSQDEFGNQEMIAVLFKHDVSRNEDPQLHTHCVIANAVQGEVGDF